MIPLWLTVRCSDPVILDRLCDPSAPVVRLLRITEDRYQLMPVDFAQVVDLATATPAYQDKMYPDIHDEIQTAVWWSVDAESRHVDTDTSNADERVLQGEIHLRPVLQPSMIVGYFKVRVRAILSS